MAAGLLLWVTVVARKEGRCVIIVSITKYEVLRIILREKEKRMWETDLMGDGESKTARHDNRNGTQQPEFLDLPLDTEGY